MCQNCSPGRWRDVKWGPVHQCFCWFGPEKILWERGIGRKLKGRPRNRACVSFFGDTVEFGLVTLYITHEVSIDSSQAEKMIFPMCTVQVR